MREANIDVRISVGGLRQCRHLLSGSRPRTQLGQIAPDGSSTSGHVMMAAHPIILRGESSTVSVLAWNSRKIRRVVRSSLGAECAALSAGLEHTDTFRVLYGEHCGDLCDLAEYATHLQVTEAFVRERLQELGRCSPPCRFRSKQDV